jgi:hypothetical protein
MAVILTLIIVLVAILFVVAPLAFLLFYRSRNVEETCKHRDLSPRWTDRLPLPILAFGLLAACGGTYTLLLAFTTPLFPFFGRYLTGLLGTGALLLLAAVDAVVAILFFRLQIAGWWLAVVAMTFRMVSAAVTFARGNLFQAYSRMGWSQKQLQLMEGNPMFRSSAFLWWSLGFMVLYLGFLLWTRRYFPSASSSGYTGVSAPLVHPSDSGS